MPDRRVDHQAGGDGRRRVAGRPHGRTRRPPPRSRPHRGPVFLDFPLDVLRPGRGRAARSGRASTATSPTPTRSTASRALIADAERPAFIVGSDVYWDGAGRRWQRAVERCACRASSTASVGAACRPTTSWRSSAPGAAEDRRRPRRRDRHAARLPPRLRPVRQRPRSPTSSTRRRSSAGHVDVPTAAGDSGAVADRLAEYAGTGATTRPGSPRLRDAEDAAAAADAALLAADADPIKPSRVYGELGRRLERDAVVICDGGDFASLRRQVRRGPPARVLARHRARTAASATARATPSRPGSPGPSSQVVAAPRRRRGRLQPDGRRHARAPRPAGRDDRRQQRHVGPGEAPDAGDLRLGRGLRPAARLPLRRGRAGARRRGRDRERARTRSGRRSTVPSPPACPTSSTS